MTSELCGNCLATHGRRNPKPRAHCMLKEIKVGINDKACGDYVNEGLDCIDGVSTIIGIAAAVFKQ